VGARRTWTWVTTPWRSGPATAPSCGCWSTRRRSSPRGARYSDAQRLEHLYGDRARIINGAPPRPDCRLTSSARGVVHDAASCPDRRAADALFAEAFRVLRPGGVFAGSGQRGVAAVPAAAHPPHLQHGPAGDLPDRLHAEGFHDVDVEVRGAQAAWRALKPLTFSSSHRETVTTDGSTRKRVASYSSRH